MITVRKSADRGHFDFGWLDTHHTFSFGEYHDPAQMGFRSLRVLNEDRVQPVRGFGRHGHRDMEILSYPLSGSVEHTDSQGNIGVIKPGVVQVMSAGTGIMHSESNPSATEAAHFIQIWIQPDKKGVAPRYEDRAFPIAQNRNRLCLIASPDGAEGSLSIHQDARVYAAILDAGAEVSLNPAEGRGLWVQAAKGGLEIRDASEGAASGNWTALAAGDGAAIQGAGAVTLRAAEAAEALVFDLA